MNSLMIKTYIKWGAIAIVVIVIGAVLWNIKSTYAENRQLHTTIANNDITIKTLKDDVKNQKDLYKEVLKRKQVVETVVKDRIVYVDKLVKGDTVYVERVKTQIQYIKEKSPETLDKYYYTVYNGILNCISDATKELETPCVTP